MGMREYIEDGFGCSGLVPTKAEREQERRENAERQANKYARNLAISLHERMLYWQRGEQVEQEQRFNPPPIPTLPCFKCEILTNATQSVYGVGCYKCFMKATSRTPYPQS